MYLLLADYRSYMLLYFVLELEKELRRRKKAGVLCISYFLRSPIRVGGSFLGRKKEEKRSKIPGVTASLIATHTLT